MKNLTTAFVILTSVVFLATGCTSKDQLKKTIEENPDIIFNAIEKNPKAFFDVLNKAAMQARQEEAAGREGDEKKALDEDFKNPKVPVVGENRVIFGNKSAPVTIVEYSDFQCPFCSKAATTLDEIKKKYGDKVRVVYKHLPFKQYAELGARYYEAVGMQGVDKAQKFYTLMYQKQNEVHSGGEKAIEKFAKQAGADIAKVKKDLNSETISKILQEDQEEANKFGFQGTPGFLVNGVRVNGAYPMEHFVMIIDRHLGQTGG